MNNDIQPQPVPAANSQAPTSELQDLFRESFRTARPKIGHGSLYPAPIDSDLAVVVEAIKQNQNTIIVSSTATGKSTRVPLALMYCGYRVVCALPTRLATEKLSEYQAFLDQSELGQEVGFRTARRENVGASIENLGLLNITDGLMTISEMWNQDWDVLIFDEAHMPRKNRSLFLAWLHELRLQGDTRKVVVMSADLPAEAIAQHMGGAEILRLEGKSFAITELPGDPDPLRRADFVAEDARDGDTVVTFVAGKSEIRRLCEELAELDSSLTCLPLHAELPQAQQDHAMHDFGHGIVIASTDVAAQSLTIPRVGHVISSGIRNRIWVDEKTGVEGLRKVLASKDQLFQERGRAGRDQPGTWRNLCPKPWDELEDYAPSEILNERIDMEILQCAVLGYPIRSLRFFEGRIPKFLIDHGEKSLRTLGLFDQQNQPTDLGREAARLLDTHSARMILEARAIGEPELEGLMIVAAGVIEAGGITLWDAAQSAQPKWRQFCRDDGNSERSDIIAQMKAYFRASKMSIAQMEAYDIDSTAIEKISQTIAILEKNTGVEAARKPPATGHLEHEMTICMLAGFRDRIYRAGDGGKYYCENDERELDIGSVVAASLPRVVVGVPFNIERVRRGQTIVARKLHSATIISPEALARAG